MWRLGQIQNNAKRRVPSYFSARSRSPKPFERLKAPTRLPYNEDAASIKEHFARECGSVRHVRLKEFDGEPGSFCGIAFVAFETDAGFIAALKQDGVAFREDDERVLKIRPDRSALARRAPPPHGPAASFVSSQQSLRLSLSLSKKEGEEETHTETVCEV